MVAVAIVIGGLFLDKNSKAESGNWKTHENKKLNYQIQYPSQWELKETVEGVVIISPQSLDEYSSFNELEIGLEIEGMYPVTVNFSNLEKLEKNRKKIKTIILKKITLTFFLKKVLLI